MADPSKQESGSKTVDESGKSVVPKGSPDATQSAPPSVAPKVDESPALSPEEIAAQKLADERLNASLRKTSAEPSAQLRKAFSRYDRRTTSPQPAEFWRHKDKDFEAHGRF